MATTVSDDRADGGGGAQSRLINGAAGGVGSFAVQIAKALIIRSAAGGTNLTRRTRGLG